MKFRRGRMPLFLLAGLLFGIKTYIIYRFVFNIEIDNMLQEIISLINLFVAAIVFFVISVCIKHLVKQRSFISYRSLIVTLIIYFNLVFYRSFTDFLTLSHLFQTSNVADLSSSIISLIK